MNTMNSAEDLQPIITNDDVDIEVPGSDTNANVSETNRGAIPKKTKTLQPPAKTPLPSTKKTTIKLNNNIENMSTLNTSEEPPKLNGIGITNNGISNHYLNNDLIEPSCSSHDSYYRDAPVTVNTVHVENNIDSDTVSIDSNDGDTTESLSEDGCIYTYKGDHVADLPSSFFYIPPNIPENQQEPVVLDDVPNRQDASSPEMDYLEMDFDPSNNGDADSASEIENEINMEEDDKSSPHIDDEHQAEMHCDSQPEYANVPSTSGTSVSRSSPRDEQKVVTNTSREDEASPILRVIEKWVADIEVSPITTPDDEKIMPWSCTLEERTQALHLPYTKRVHCTRGEVMSPSEIGAISLDITSLLERKHRKKSEPSSDVIEPAMIWTREEAYLKQVTQIGPSSCGATAVLNVLKALRFPVPSLDKLRECVTTRLRDNNSPLTKYLITRSRAGSTHKDLIDGLHKVSNGTIYARFFHMYPERVVNMYTWLAFWIQNGAVPIATLNLQRCLGPIPDAWHHQMIYGVDANGIHLTNPIECVDASLLWPQLCSESVLLVRRLDVLSRWNFNTDMPDLMRINDERWQRMNVVGQVANLVHENNRGMRAGVTNTSHIRIPAAYSSGITLATTVNSPAFTLLKQSPELPHLLPRVASTAATCNY